MELVIELVCPECNELLSLNFMELAPGRRRECSLCRTPMQLTTAGLERFRRDLRVYCEN